MKKLTDLEIAQKLEEIEREEPKQEIRYSEEEVIKLLETFAPHIRYKYKELPETWVEVVKEWFKKFKKK